MTTPNKAKPCRICGRLKPINEYCENCGAPASTPPADTPAAETLIPHEAMVEAMINPRTPTWEIADPQTEPTAESAELEQILSKLKYVVENRRITEKEWQAGIWFDVTNEVRTDLQALLASAKAEGRREGGLKELYAARFELRDNDGDKMTEAYLTRRIKELGGDNVHPAS